MAKVTGRKPRSTSKMGGAPRKTLAKLTSELRDKEHAGMIKKIQASSDSPAAAKAADKALDASALRVKSTIRGARAFLKRIEDAQKDAARKKTHKFVGKATTIKRRRKAPGD